MKRMRHWTRGLRCDDGWNFIEAVFSMMLMTVVFLGFTITLLAFREWLERSWALRMLDQYANDAINSIEDQLRLSHAYTINTQQYGRGSATFWVDSLDYSNQANLIPKTWLYTFTCKPHEGIFQAQDNGSPQNVYWGNDVWPPTSWENKHEFDFTEFVIDSAGNTGLPSYFNQAMVSIHFKIKYERPRTLEITGGFQSKTFVLEKEYRLSTFLKNRLIAR